MKNLKKHDLLLDILKLEFQASDLQRLIILISKYRPFFKKISKNLYSKLSKPDRRRFVVWFLKRWAGIDLVNPIEMASYLGVIEAVKNEITDFVVIKGKEYKLQDLSLQGYDFKLAAYDWVLSIHDVYFNQYEHRDFKVNSGDVIIDAGGFIGDTAALFCRKTSGDCKVHSFEILDENIDLFAFNNSINGIEDKVVINKFALLTRQSNRFIV